MKDAPVFTLGTIVTKEFFGAPTSGIEPLLDAAGNVIFFESHDQAVQACAEENDKGRGWWIIVPRMLRSIRDE